MHKFAVMADEGGVVLPEPPVFPDLPGIGYHVAKQKSEPFACRAQRLIPRSVVSDERIDFPHVSQDVPGHAHLGKGDDLHALSARLIDHRHHSSDVQIGAAGLYLELGERNLRQGGGRGKCGQWARQATNQPPSMTSSVPVTHSDSSLAR